jgi:hypothetical protein
MSISFLLSIYPAHLRQGYPSRLQRTCQPSDPGDSPTFRSPTSPPPDACHDIQGLGQGEPPPPCCNCRNDDAMHSYPVTIPPPHPPPFAASTCPLGLFPSCIVRGGHVTDAMFAVTSHTPSSRRHHIHHRLACAASTPVLEQHNWSLEMLLERTKRLRQ